MPAYIILCNGRGDLMNWTNLEAAIPYDALLDLGITWPCSRNAQAIHSPSSSKFHRSFFAKKSVFWWKMVKVKIKYIRLSHRFCPVLGLWIFHLNHSYPFMAFPNGLFHANVFAAVASRIQVIEAVIPIYVAGQMVHGTLDRNGPCPNGFAYFYGDQNPKIQHLMILIYVWCVFFWRVVRSLGKLVMVPKCCFASFSLKSLGDARNTEHET